MGASSFSLQLLAAAANAAYLSFLQWVDSLASSPMSNTDLA